MPTLYCPYDSYLILDKSYSWFQKKKFMQSKRKTTETFLFTQTSSIKKILDFKPINDDIGHYFLKVTKKGSCYGVL
jgi:hypothetical protein